jgi:3-oxoacyl-[acyl-carrier protein] reductase
MSLHGKVALVTGSSRGIGRAIALRYAQLGADLVINHLRDAAASEVQSAANAAGVKAITVPADVSDVSQIEHLFTTAIEAFGKIDIAVSNAGVEKVNIPVTDVTEEDFDLLFKVNTKGAFFVMQAAARHVADGGRIINIASSSTSRPHPGLGLYGASKTAPKYLVQVLAQEIGHRKVTVNSLVPGPIDGAGIFAEVTDDDLYKKALLASVPIGALATPENVADIAEFVASDKSFFITGEEILMNGGSSN